MRRLLFATLITFVCVTAFNNKSYPTEFTAVAAGCVPDPINIQGNDYLVTAGSVKHQADALHEIHLRCPISIIITKPTRIYLIASDNDVFFTSQTFVNAKLVSHPYLFDGPVEHCSVDTAQAPQDGIVHLIDVACSFLPGWDQTNSAFFLEITIRRRIPSFTVVFYGAGVY